MKISAVMVAILVSLSVLMVAQDAGSNHNCPALGKQYETKLDKFTKIGRVAWSPYLKSCVAETNNIMSGTEMYSVIAIPSEKFLGASGGLTSFLDTKRD